MPTIYSINPTVLMVKRHNKTGLLYFHKTWRLHLLETYQGSGSYWNNHLDKHGHDWTTIWTSEIFEDSSIVDFATKFSEDHDIVKSSYWANQRIEDGLDGGQEGYIHREESKRKTSDSLLKTREEKSWGFSETGKQINDKRMADGTHQMADPEWHKKNNPWITNNPSKKRFKCSITGIESNKSGFAQRAKHKGWDKWPHGLIEL